MANDSSQGSAAGSQHELNEADLLQLEGAFSSSGAQTSIAPGDSTQSLLDLELTDPDAKLAETLTQAKGSPEKAGSAGTSPSKRMSTFGSKMADAFKKGMRSRSPSFAGVSDSAIPFSAPSNNASNDMDFFSSVVESQPRGRGPAKSSATSPERLSVDSRGLPSRPSLEQRLHNRSSTMPVDSSASASLSPSSAIMDFSTPQLPSIPTFAHPSYTDDLPQLIPVPVLSSVDIDPKYSTLPTRRWTDFSAFHQIPNIDPVNDILNRAFAGDDSIFRPPRSLLTLEEAERDHGADKALDVLIQHKSWKAVAILSRNRLLTLAPTPDRFPAIMKWWVFRLTALERLKLYDVLFAELDSLGNLESPSFLKESHPDSFPNAKGSMVSFDLRLFWARSPALRGNHNEALSRLFRLSYDLKKAPLTTSEEERKIYQSRQSNLQLTIVGILLEVKDYRLAVSMLESFIVAQPRDFRMISALGRVHLQYGGVTESRKCFERVEKILRRQPTGSERESDDDFENYDMILANRGFVAIADGDWELAARWLNDLISRDPSNSTAINNLAVCHLYMGDVSRAISFLESVIVEMPRTAGANGSLLFNVSTLFDLADRSLERKQRLITNVVSKSAGDDLDVSCLKLGSG